MQYPAFCDLKLIKLGKITLEINKTMKIFRIVLNLPIAKMITQNFLFWPGILQSATLCGAVVCYAGAVARHC